MKLTHKYFCGIPSTLVAFILRKSDSVIYLMIVKVPFFRLIWALEKVNLFENTNLHVLLSSDEIKEMVQTLKKWKREGVRITKDFIFENFDQAIDFVNKIRPIANSVKHHPDIFIYFNRVRLEVMTHDEGGLTEKDFELAKKIDELTG